MEFSRKSEIDVEGPIDFDFVKAHIQEHGMLRLRAAGNPFQLFMDITPCACLSPTCETDVITIIRQCGMSEIKWLVDKAELLEFACLDDFFRWCQISGPASSSGERQVIERHISDFLHSNYMEVDEPFCACSACAATLEQTELWKNHLLRSLALHLQALAEATAELEDDDRDDWQHVFDQGYALGRLVGEYHLKSQVEEIAQKGLAAEAAISNRTAASGQSSAKKRQERIEQMLGEMERLMQENPAFRRMPMEDVAGLAIEDAAAKSPDLWSQGKGQKIEYLDELKADLKYRARFEALLSAA